MRWIIQKNLGNTIDSERMISAAQAIGAEALGVDVIPFSDDLPDIPNDRPTVFYGATGFINSIHLKGSWNPGVFYDADKFRYTRYLLEYGERMLNSSVELTTLELFSRVDRDPDAQVFIRPDRDLKEFAGEVITCSEFSSWAQKVSHGGFTVKPDCPIVIAPPVGISREWRTFIVNGRVVTGSQYRRDRVLDVSPGLPDRVAAFADECARSWSPAPVYALDVAQSGGQLYVLELGCFNSAGMYACDIELLIKEISHHIK